ncbi:IclR family transcriptional regulator [Peristeroidobacter soli]|uniref:IclR family transcriptional regulator n=1 Tax=Peristeroidobacter soli TaxID=2497877 RepID=UPI00101CE08B|nr:IclR family transcriptional regulator [Peristeroidobacter soli]
MSSARLTVVSKVKEGERPTKRATGAVKVRRSGPRSVTRLLNVLRVLALSEESVSLAQLSLAIGTPKTSLLALLRTLVEAGYVVQREAGYTLGTETFALGSTIIGRRKLGQLAWSVLQKLAEQSGETALLAELSSDAEHAIYIDRAEGSRAVRFVASVGDRRPLYSSACGRILLAFQSEQFRKDYLARAKLMPLNPKKKLGRSELEGIIREIRQSNLTITDDDITEGVVGIGAPIFGLGGEVVAALAIGVPVERVNKGTERLSRLVRSGAEEISEILGRTHTDQSEQESD